MGRIQIRDDFGRPANAHRKQNSEVIAADRHESRISLKQSGDLAALRHQKPFDEVSRTCNVEPQSVGQKVPGPALNYPPAVNRD